MILNLLPFLLFLNEVEGHGRLLEPPSRSSMWRFGYKTDVNHNDHELYCGGYYVQWEVNEGKCGVCGDRWDTPEPRDNEACGKYGKGIIVREYGSAQVITTTVQITANHKGYFEFKICPTNDGIGKATQECFDQYPLNVAGTSEPKYFLPDDMNRNYVVNLTLPAGLHCSHCVFQWTYTAGNSWGECPGDEPGRLGCGPQETFRGCADVRILAKGTMTHRSVHSKDSRSPSNINTNTENSSRTQSSTSMSADSEFVQTRCQQLYKQNTSNSIKISKIVSCIVYINHILLSTILLNKRIL